MKKKLLSAALAALMIFTLSACGRGPANQVHSASDMAGRVVGVLDGSLSEAYMTAFGRASEIRTYGDPGALAAGLRGGEIDCALVSSEDAGAVARSGLTTLSEPFADDDYAIPVSVENRLMIENLESAMVYLRASGELRAIIDRWESGGGTGEYEPEDGYEPVTVAISADVYPYAFFDENGNLAGIEVDVARALSHRLELEPVFNTVSPDILLYMAESGKTAFAIGRIASDPSNGAVAFTSSYLHSTQLIVVRK